MPLLSRVRLVGQAGVQTYAFPFPILGPDEVGVAVDGSAVGAAELTVDTVAGTVAVSLAGHTFVGGEDLLVHRATPLPDADRYTDPADGAPLDQDALDALQLQLLHLAQELQDVYGGDPHLGPAGGLVTWNGAGEPPQVLSPGAADQILTAHGPGQPLTWENPGGPGSGEANTTSDAGVGIGLTLPKVGLNLPQKSLLAGANMVLVDLGNEVRIDGPTPAAAEGANVGGGAGVFRDRTGSTLNFRSLTDDNVVNALEAADTVELSLDQDAVRLATGAQAGFLTAADFTKLAGIEAGAQVCNAANVNLAGAVMETDYNLAHALLRTTGAASVPSVAAVGANQIVGRQGLNNIAGLSTSTVLAVLQIADRRTFNLSTPVAGMVSPKFQSDRAITVSSIRAVVEAVTVGDQVTWNVYHHPEIDAGVPNQVLVANEATTVAAPNPGETVSTGFGDNTIPSGSWVWVEIASTTGAPDMLSLSLIASFD